MKLQLEHTWRSLDVAGGDAATRILVHVVRSPRCTVRSCADAAGISVSVAHHHLVALRDARLVTWDFGRAATIRALVHEVPL